VTILSTRRGLFIALAAVGIVLIALVVASGIGLATGAPVPLSVLVVLVAFGLAALWAAHTAVDEHFAELDRLSGDLAVAAAAGTPLSPRWTAAGGPSAEVKRLAEAAAAILDRRPRTDAAIDARLRAILAAVGEGVVVVTDTGLVSLVNRPARDRFGSAAVAVGTSVYAALDRTSLAAAMAEARRSQRPVEVTLATVDGDDLPATVVDLDVHGGAVLCFAVAGTGSRSPVEHDLTLHDRPPPAPPPAPDVPLDRLAMLVVDIETTGLDVRRDRILSIAALPLHGARAYKAHILDKLVNPGVAIPPRSSMIHGITDAMIETAPSFAELAEELMPLVAGRVMVGHNIGFDAAMLRREAAIAGIDWIDPPTLCLTQLEAMLVPEGTDLGLDAMAARRGIAVHGRHTALGDALVAADILAQMLPVLAERGVTTLGQAVAFAARATSVIEDQRAAGWFGDTPAP
jgi:DNA polymerase-3 subunit epsilon